MTPENRDHPPSPAGPGEAAPAPVTSDSMFNLANTVAEEPALLQNPKSASDKWVGKTLGKYRVISTLGQGAMGVVLKAHDTTIERDVAIKVLAEHLAADANALSRFLAEARAVGKINHPNVMGIYEICQDGPIHYLVLEYVAGGSVEDLLSRRVSLSVFEATQALIDACKGVAAAHQAGLIHRDIKPANFMRAADGAIKVADFGLAKATAASQGGVTQAGMVVGTPLYMSPEQCQAKPLDQRSDIYSLGATYYTLLTGASPYPEAESVMQMMYLHCYGPVLDPRSLNAAIPESCSHIVARATAKAPTERYQSTAEMLADLQAVLAAVTRQAPVGATMTARTPAVGASSTRSLSRHRTQSAERRQVTLLVCGCNLFESAAYLEKLDAEEQAKVQREFQQACNHEVQRFGGAVVQCNERGLLACFGYPVAHEDAASRAVKAGLDLLKAMNALGVRLQGEQGLELRPWLGLHTGLAIVETKEDMISLVGDARNVAVRLEDVAAPGQLICSESTHRLLRGQFQSASLGRKKIKGASHAVEFFQLRCAAESNADAQGAQVTPLTGRDHELSLLEARWEQAREGMGQVVLLVGEAGLGKSRLVHAVKALVQGQIGDETAEDLSVVEWRCAPHYQNTGLYPAIDFYERALGFGSEEPAAAKFDRLLRRLEKYDLAQSETVPLWASLLSVPTPDRFAPLCLSPARQREETFRVMADWLHARAAAKPTLFIVEDLHWADASTLEFLGQYLAECACDQMLAVLTFRPEFNVPWQPLPHQTRLALTRLTRRQVGDLMRHQSGAEMPPEVVDQVYDRAGGVPLFVEEFTKMMQETQMQGAGRPKADALPMREIPSTLQDLVMARLDRMESGRELAQIAAVLGREFSFELLSAVANMEERTLQAELASLVQADILHQKGRVPSSTYQFKHALLEDALYLALVKSKRQEFHRRIGEGLESRFRQITQTRPELLAHHFAEAGLTQNAIAYWLKAGRRSRDRSAFCEAIGHLTKGLSLLDQLEESRSRDDWELSLLTALAPAYIGARGYAAPEVGPILVRARELCQRIGDRHQQFGIMLGMWEWHIVRGDLRACVSQADDGMALAQSIDDPGMWMEALFMPGVTMFYRGQFDTACACFQTALAEYDNREHARFWTAYSGHDAGVTHRCYLALAMWHLGYPDQALEMAREMQDLARKIGHAFSLEHAVDFSAFLYLYCRLGTKAEAMADEEMAIATEQSFPFWHALGMLHKGAAWSMQGRGDEALPMLLKGFSAFRATGAELRVPAYLGLLGEAYTKSARFADARKALDEALAIAEKNDDRCHEAELVRLKGELVLAESPDAGAAAECCFRQAIETARRQHSRAWELRATVSLARLCLRQSRREEGHAALAAIYGKYTEGFTTPDLMDAAALLRELA